MTTWRIVLILAMGAALLSIAACDREITRIERVETAPSDCFNCHSDQETFVVSAQAQWEHSVHASGDNIDRNTPPCSGCHTSQGFKERVAGNPVGTYPNPTAIHCFTCHLPHTDRNLEPVISAPQPLENGAVYDFHGANICTACHHALQSVDTYIDSTVTLSAHWGPHHGPQTDMLIGSNGYEYEGYDYLQLVFHKTLTDDGCLDCHMETTSNYVVGGHSFNMAAMLQGEEILNTAACDKCHLDLSDFNYHDIQDSVTVLKDDLLTALVNAGLMLPDGEPESVTTSADSAGAVWNFLIVDQDRSMGVHNSRYIIGLLESSIQYLAGDLPQDGVREAPRVTLRAQRRR